MEINIGNNVEFAGIKSPYVVEVDPTLTKQGQAADAKVTGSVVDKADAAADAAEQAQEYAEYYSQKAEAAMTRYPYIGENGDWFVWDVESEEFVDTGVQAEPDLSDYATTEFVYEELALKQDQLNSGENIKTVDGESILGEGDLTTVNYHTFNGGWVTNESTSAFCSSIVSDDTTKAGMTYLGKVYCSDLPGLVQAECVVEIISQDLANGKNIHLILTSAEVSPYRWEYSYVKINGSYAGTGWKAYATTDWVTNNTSANPTTTSSDPTLTSLKVNGTNYNVGGNLYWNCVSISTQNSGNCTFAIPSKSELTINNYSTLFSALPDEVNIPASGNMQTVTQWVRKQSADSHIRVKGSGGNSDITSESTTYTISSQSFLVQ